MQENPPPPPAPKAPAVHYTLDNRGTGASTLPLNGQKKISRRSSKPIINWLHRKLVGTGRAKRTEHRLPATRNRIESRTGGRAVTSPLPPENGTHRKKDSAAVSLGSDFNARRISSPPAVGDTSSMDQSFFEGQSVRWSRRSQREADEDASLRPLPPSSPPSPSPSLSSSSYNSDLHTFRSIAASTKPTTLLSIDMHAGGMAHIAQAPLTPTTQFTRGHPHARNSSTHTNPGVIGSAASITFSSLPPIIPPDAMASRPSSSLLTPSSATAAPTTQTDVPISSVQAPLHTSHHPRNNPRPSSPPMDNASMLTLASSAFGIPGRRGVELSLRSRPFSAVGDSVSHFGAGSLNYPDIESNGQSLLGDDDRLDDRDVDASVRALRPRSSRRGSWESETSDWSAQIGGGLPFMAKNELSWSAVNSKPDALDVDTLAHVSTDNYTSESGSPASPGTPPGPSSESGSTPPAEDETKVSKLLTTTTGNQVKEPISKVNLHITAVERKMSESNKTNISMDSSTDAQTIDEFHSAPTTPLASKLHL